MEGRPSATLEDGWSRTDREHEQTIMLHHRLSMTSGLSDSLEYLDAPQVDEESRPWD